MSYKKDGNVGDFILVLHKAITKGITEDRYNGKLTGYKYPITPSEGDKAVLLEIRKLVDAQLA